MIEMLKRHEIQVLRRAGHTWQEVARLSGVSVRTVRRVGAEAAVTTVDNKAERARRQVGRPSKADDAPDARELHLARHVKTPRITTSETPRTRFGSSGAALWILPIHGVFVPNDNDVAVIIERIAMRHLGLESARKAFRAALADVEPLVRREAIESAHGQVRAAAEEAYFYAGLAVGVTLMATR
jgi:hypothetical protein